MDDLTASKCIETMMDYMKFCTYVIDTEMKRFNLDLTVYQSFVDRLHQILDVNFDIAYNRCAFVYKYTLCNMHFFKDCMKKFILECTEFQSLLSKWTADSNVRLCSLSCGPGLDYLSFMLALSDQFDQSPTFKSVTVLSKHGAWRNTVGIVADALEEGLLSKGIEKQLNFKNIEVVQANLLISMPMKAIEQSSVLLMVKTFNLTESVSNGEIIKTRLLELISSLNPETVIFFVDTKPCLALFLEVLSKFPGKFLYNPAHLSFRVPITFSDDYKEKHGCFPVVNARGAFFVWQKLSRSEGDPNFIVCNYSSLTNVQENSENLSEKANNGSDEMLNITKTVTNKNPESNIVSVINSSHINNNTRESVSATVSPVNTCKQLVINKSISSQALSIQEENSIFDDMSSSSHSLKKSTSIDNCFFQGSSKSISFLGKSDLLQNFSLNTCSAEHRAIQNKIVPINNQAIKPTSESKATQTELHQFSTRSSLVKDLTERVKRLVSSLENEVQKNIPEDEINHHLDGVPNKSTNYPPFSTNSNNNSDMDIKPPCCERRQSNQQSERKNPVSYCNCVQANGIHCCELRHNTIHICEMHCRSCIHRCHIHPYRPCENNIASVDKSITQPQIILPLQNVSNDILLQIISAIKSGSTVQ